MKRMLIFMLALACIGFTGCKKDKSAETSPETTRTETISETNSRTETEDFPETKTKSKSKTKTPTGTETETSHSGKTTTTGTGTETGTTTKPETTTTAVFLDAENALQEAEIDEEERKAFAAVQQTEPLIYYKDPNLDFDKDSYPNLQIDIPPIGKLYSDNGANVKEHFYEKKTLSGADLLFMKNAVENVSGIAFDAEQVKSSTGKSLEESEKVIYRNDSHYAEMDKFGNFHIQSNTLPNDFSPEQENQIIWSDDFRYVEGRDFPQVKDLNFSFGEESVSAVEEIQFLNEYFQQAEELGWIGNENFVMKNTTIYMEVQQENGEMEMQGFSMKDFFDVREIQLEDGKIGYLWTFKISSKELYNNGIGLEVGCQTKSRYENDDRAVKGQYVQALMLSPHSVDYLYLPPILTRNPDYQQNLSGTFCTSSEAFQLISDSLPQGEIYQVSGLVRIFYETVFLNDENHEFQGLACVPMFHVELISPTGEMIFADVNLDTKELYFSYE